MTSGPSLPSSMSTPGDLQAHDLGGAPRCARTRVEVDRLDGAPRCVGAELVALGDPAHGGHHPVADDQCADVAALALLDEALDQHLLLGAVQGLDDRLGDLAVGGRDDADAPGLRAA